MYIQPKQDTENGIRIATCELDHKVWNFFHTLFPDTLYGSVVQGNTDEENAAELTRRFARANLPPVLRLVLNMIELDNHDFTVHSLFDSSTASVDVNDIKNEFKLRNLGVRSRISQTSAKRTQSKS